jgi:hypothetical protein
MSINSSIMKGYFFVILLFMGLVFARLIGTAAAEAKPRVETNAEAREFSFSDFFRDAANDNVCLLGQPPIGTCNLLIEAYCDALVSCLVRTTNISIPSNLLHPKGDNTQSPIRNKIAHAPRDAMPSIADSAIKYHCMKEYACKNS